VSPKALPDDGSLSPLQALLAWKYNPYMHKSPKNDKDIPVKIKNKIYFNSHKNNGFSTKFFCATKWS
jgi:hypothetical protein